MKMKCLSLIQPWASLVMAGAKRFETRSWATPYRGPLAVHASSRFPQAARELCRKEPFRTALARAGIEHASRLPLGKLLGVVELVAVHKVEDLTAEQLTYEEKCFGDYRVGRRAWEFCRPSSLAVPVVLKGQLGIVEIDYTPIRSARRPAPASKRRAS
jgi:hypothetical protein